MLKILPRPYQVTETGGSSALKNTNFQTDSSLGKEEYRLTVKNGEATATCGSERAKYYAELTLAQITAPDGTAPDCEIHDRPHFSYRSFMLDSARHYQSIDEIKKFIKVISELKMNIFHWHLSEDQGWRIESETHPELNAAAVRKYSDFGKTRDDQPYGIYYTKEQIRDVVAYAAEHHVDVVPEIDIPGHTSALLSVFPQLTCDGKPVEVKTHQGIFEDVICPAKEEALRILKDLFDELCELFPYEIYHIGGDEVKHDHWESCPDCQKKMKELGLTSYNDYENWFLCRIADYLAEKGKRCIVWNDAASGSGLHSKNMIVQYWKENDPHTVNYANTGGNLILSPFSYYYLDYDYDITSLRRTQAFPAELKGLTEKGRANILGVEAPLWTEYINHPERAEELVFPRLLAVACTAWEENRISYREFLDNAAPTVQRLKDEGFVFRDEKEWHHMRVRTPFGWLRFVKTNYSVNYILKQV